jgi:aspartate aminotransferase
MSNTQIAIRLKSIRPSETLALTQKAAELKAAGKDVLSLTAGEPDFRTPAWICEAATQAMKNGQTKYTPVGGTPELKQAIANKFARDNSLTYALDQIIVSTGGKQVIFNALMATVNPGDEVLIPDPYWVSYPSMVEIAQGIPCILACPESQGFKLKPEQLETAITSKTKWFILNSPSNPTGAMYTYEELWQLGQVLLRHPHVLILSDDIYEHVIFEGHTFHTLAEVEPSLKERILTVNGVSKSYAMTGWRIGYGAGPLWLIKAMTALQSQSTSNACSIAQAAARAGLEGSHGFLTEWVTAYQKRRDILVEGLNAIPGLSCLTPPATFYAFPSCLQLTGKKTPLGDHITNDQDFCTYLLEEAGVIAVPGNAFGRPNHFRLSYATDLSTITQALVRIKAAVEKL